MCIVSSKVMVAEEDIIGFKFVRFMPGWPGQYESEYMPHNRTFEHVVDDITKPIDDDVINNPEGVICGRNLLYLVGQTIESPEGPGIMFYKEPPKSARGMKKILVVRVPKGTKYREARTMMSNCVDALAAERVYVERVHHA